MPPKTNPTLVVLREIRDELKGTNARLDRVEQRVEALEHRQAESEVRLASELVAVGKAIGEVRDLLRDRLDLRDRVEEHERRIVSLERRVPG
jgi:chromosome segregation ATPase